jgi:hypothetical protein
MIFSRYRVYLRRSFLEFIEIRATSWPPQEKIFIWPPFFNITNASFAPKNGWGMRVYAPGSGHENTADLPAGHE